VDLDLVVMFYCKQEKHLVELVAQSRSLLARVVLVVMPRLQLGRALWPKVAIFSSHLVRPQLDTRAAV